MHDTNTKYIHYGDIHTGKVKIINDINILPNIKDNNYIGLNKGDIVVADASEDYKGIADACLVNTDTDSNKIVAGLHTIALRPQKDTYPQYLYTYLSTDIFKHFGYKTGTGLKVFGISYKELAKFLVSSPSIKEQKEISKLISLIEKNIDLQQRKTQLLNKVIKYLTQNLFIQSDSLIPVLRFLSFNKKWTSTKIGKIMDVGSVKRIHQSDWRESGIPFYRARDIIAIRQNKELPSPIYISHEQYENYSETSGKVNMNDLLVTGVGTIGVPLLVKKTPIYFKDGNIIWLKNSNKLNGNFLFYVFQSSKIQDYIHSIAGVGTVPTYTIDSAKKTPIVFPEKSEQTDIANLLNTVTNMVHMSKSKKRVLMSIKNYLLQNMFI